MENLSFYNLYPQIIIQLWHRKGSAQRFVSSFYSLDTDMKQLASKDHFPQQYLHLSVSCNDFF